MLLASAVQGPAEEVSMSTVVPDPGPPDGAPGRRPREVTLRFLAAPTDGGYSGGVDGGRVLEWIDKAGYALAAAWSGRYCVTAYVGNVRFASPVRTGDLVEVTARLVHTGRSSMHIETTVRSGPPTGGALGRRTQCLLIFVAVDGDGRPSEVPAWVADSEEDHVLEDGAVRRIALRAEIEKAMADQELTGAGTAPQVVLRFLAAPTDVNWGGKVHGGIVMRWVDEAAHVLATRWTGSSENVAVYAGGFRFYRPLLIGHLVEVEARLLHTGTTSMHIGVHVRSGDPRETGMGVTTHCTIVFVAVGEDGAAAPSPTWVPVTAEDVALEEHAVDLIRLRAALRDAAG
jgi:4-hydroxybenzoyl-CoA thioesterase